MAERLKISVITPVFNAETMIRHCMDSVAQQTYPNKEHIIVDGFSSDNTVDVINRYKGNHVEFISERDRGLYDAFNKGIDLATGDIVCFLCADDMYAHADVLATIANSFELNADADMIYGDVVYVDRMDLHKVTRYWKSSPFKPGLFKKGWLPPHTALFIRRSLFKKYGVFSLKYKMASDYELQFRFFEKHKLKSLYITGIMTRMRSGGMSNSSIGNMYISLSECYSALVGQNVSFPFIYIFNTLFYRLKQTRVPQKIKNLNSRQIDLLLHKEGTFIEGTV